MMRQRRPATRRGNDLRRPNSAGSGPRRIIKRRYCIAVLSRQPKGEHVNVLCDVSGFHRFRYRNKAAFDVPAQDDLRRRSPVAVGDRSEGGYE